VSLTLRPWGWRVLRNPTPDGPDGAFEGSAVSRRTRSAHFLSLGALIYQLNAPMVGSVTRGGKPAAVADHLRCLDQLFRFFQIHGFSGAVF